MNNKADLEWEEYINAWKRLYHEHYTLGEDSEDPIVRRVLKRFNERSQVGIKKYSTTLERNDLSVLEWLTELQHELMDATLYIERLKDEQILTNKHK